MSTALRLMVLLFAPTLALAADDARVTRLEQDVRTLQRDLQSVSRQIEQMRLQTTRPGLDTSVAPPALLIAAAPSWVDAGKWKQLKTGMSELEVIGTLGVPTSTRETNGTRELLYAIEIGPTAFLAGSVVFRDRQVVEVRTPKLQ